MKRKVRVPYFETGVKCYIYGDPVLELAKASDEASVKYDVDVLFIAPYVDIRRIREACPHLVIIAPYMDTLKTGRGIMPYIYEGVEATVVAEENDMSCMLYRGSDNQLYAGWIQSIRLLEEFPGETFTVGDEPVEVLPTRDDITVSWSKRSWLDSQQNYSVLSEEVKSCRGFTLEYQIIVENTSNWNSILGDRNIYVKCGDEWIEVGSFEYSDFGAVKIHVYLDQPMDINAVGTIADCTQPNIFRFRQTAYDFLVE